MSKIGKTTRSVNSRERGFGMLEVGLALAVGATLAILGGVQMFQAAGDIREDAAAEHVKMATNGMHHYVTDNYGSLTTSQVIQISTLTAAAYLPSSFSTGPFGHRYEILVKAIDQNGDGVRDAIDALLVAGDRNKTIEASRIPGIVAKVGASGGEIDGNIVYGAFAGWSDNLTNYPVSSIPDLEIASIVHFDDLAIEQDYLNRKAVAGRPEFNTMETDLNMGGHNITNTNTLTATAVNAGTANVTGDADVGGDVYARSFYYTSDVNLKQDFKAIDRPLDRLLQVHGVTFNWREDGEADVGLMAQEVQQYFPQLVNQAPDGHLTVKYGNLIAPVIEAIRELRAKNVSLELEMRAMRGERLTPQEVAFMSAMSARR